MQHTYLPSLEIRAFQQSPRASSAGTSDGRSPVAAAEAYSNFVGLVCLDSNAGCRTMSGDGLEDFISLDVAVHLV